MLDCCMLFSVLVMNYLLKLIMNFPNIPTQSNARAIQNARMEQGEHILGTSLTYALFKPWDRKYKDMIGLGEGKY